MPTRLEVDLTLRLAPADDPEARARAIALEQTVELPSDCVPTALYDSHVGRVEGLAPLGDAQWRCTIGYNPDLIAGELPQLLNVLFGNISLQQGIRLTDIRWPKPLLNALGGPRHGIAGFRATLGLTDGEALLCTALKPVGLDTDTLAGHAYRFARGGIDLVKDDHGLTNQRTAPFHQRLAACQEAVARANRETGQRCLYLPNVTAPWPELDHRLAAARDAGCQAVLISPWLTGLDLLRWAREQYGLILMAHPALTGGLFHPDHGIAPELLLGDLFRLAGADASIYPNTGGRFGFSLECCERINHRLRRPLGPVRPGAPTPGGGMDADRAADWLEAYGADTIFLIGGSLYAQGDVEAAAARLRRAIGRPL